MSLFVNKNEEIEIKVFFAKDNELKEYFSPDRDSLEKNETIDKSTIKEYSAFFRKPNYSDVVDIFSKSIVMIDGQIRIDPSILRYKKFSVLLARWNFTYEDGAIVPIDNDSIANLNPEVAGILTDGLEKIIE